MPSLPHLTRRQLVYALIISVASALILLVSLVSSSTNLLSTAQSRLDPWAVKNSAQGIGLVVIEKVRANLGFESGYLPQNERPVAEDESGAGLFDVFDNPTEESIEQVLKHNEEGSGLIYGWNVVKNKSNAFWKALGSKIPFIASITSSARSATGSTFYNPFISSSHRPVTDWDLLPLENKAFKEWEYSRGLVYEGTGARVQRFLEKARSGKGFVVAVVGGSVSKGRGLPKVPFDEAQGDYYVYSAKHHPQPTKHHDFDDQSSHEQRSVPEEDPFEFSAAAESANKREQSQGSEFNKQTQLHTTTSSTHQLNKRLHADEFPFDPNPQVSRNLYNPLNLHSQIFGFLNRIFPAVTLPNDLDDPGNPTKNPPGTPPDDVQGTHSSHHHYRGKNTFINGAQGGVGSDYFAGCWKEHLPEDADLVIVELGINDVRDINAMENYELLLRSLLEMPSRPAVINVQ